MTHSIFIDGEAGTTGLKILERLNGRKELTLVQIPDKQRKDVKARTEALNSADISILCLPDDASKEAISLVEDNKVGFYVDPENPNDLVERIEFLRDNPDIVKEMGADIVLAVDVSATSRNKSELNNIYDIVYKTLQKIIE